ncbi:MAG TPA: phosphoribosyltransferase family protein [Anaerolineae bacterium]|nr:phosphoribosyltransferase family protein [Anaerolineae bacterium]HPL29461.1 phosphoribosyltransferase family protein [Anaerolineae bacterium]
MALTVLQTIPAMPASWYFQTREEAGRRLADELLQRAAGAEALVLAVPRGGVPVGLPIALALGAPLDVIVPRKIPIPWEPEAGLGAVTEDGTTVLNEELLPLLGLEPEEIARAAQAVQQEIARRSRVYRERRGPPPVAGRLVVLVDDGLASGYTMIAALRSVRAHEPQRLAVAVPVAPRRSLERVAAEADDVLCLIAQEGGPFAVASYYRQFPELSDEQVLRDLRQAQQVAG